MQLVKIKFCLVVSLLDGGCRFADLCLSPERRADSNKENNQKEKKRVTTDSLKHMVKRSSCTGAGPATGKIHSLTTEGQKESFLCVLCGENFFIFMTKFQDIISEIAQQYKKENGKANLLSDRFHFIENFKCLPWSNFIQINIV